MDLAPYLKKAKRARVRWMLGTEKGAANPKPQRPFVDVFLYNHSSWFDMVDTYTHEVVHLVHPEWEENEAAIKAVTVGLMNSPEWVSKASLFLGEATLRLILWMRKHRKYEAE